MLKEDRIIKNGVQIQESIHIISSINGREGIIYGLCIDFLFNDSANYSRDFSING